MLRIGAGLVALGIEPKQTISILAEGCNNWILSELGLLYAGAISVPLSIKLEESNDLLFRLRHADVVAIFVSQYQLPKIRRIKEQLPLLKHIIVYDNIELEEGEMTLEALKKMGDELLAERKEEFLAIGQAVENDDYATITYTSGTTADPKGVVLTHRNYTANVEQAQSRITIPSDKRTLIILPLDHCFAHVCGFYIIIACGVKTSVDKDNVLQCKANGEFTYALRGVHAKVSVEWRFMPPAGTGDTHYSLMRGSNAELVIRQGPAQGFKPVLYVKLRKGADKAKTEAALDSAIAAIAADYPGVKAVPANGEEEGAVWKIDVPKKYDIGHEAHFSQVMQQFLTWVKAGKMPEMERRNLLVKYYTLTEAWKMSR